MSTQGSFCTNLPHHGDTQGFAVDRRDRRPQRSTPSGANIRDSHDDRDDNLPCQAHGRKHDPPQG